MQIQVNTDNNLKGREAVVALVRTSVKEAVERFSDRITRVEAHLSDTNSRKSKGDDIRCVLEARLAGLKPVAASHQAATVDVAVAEAAEKLQRLIKNRLGRIQDR